MNYAVYEKIDCQKAMIHPLSTDSQSSSTGSVEGLFTGGGFGVTAFGSAGAVTGGLAGVCTAACDGGAMAVSASPVAGEIGVGERGALGPFPSASLDLYSSTIDCNAGCSSFARWSAYNSLRC